MKRHILSLSVIATAMLATSAFAQSAMIGGATMPRPVPRADGLGPRSTDSTVAEAVARSQIQQVGYSGVRDLIRTSNGGWQGVARGHNNAPVVVALDNQGKVTEVR